MAALTRKQMASEHTPGPWRLKGEGSITDNDGGLVATCGYRVRVGSEEDESNARLIAAAPDLLAALEGLYLVVAQLTVDDPTHYEVATKCGTAGLAADMAIKKARGNHNRGVVAG